MKTKKTNPSHPTGPKADGKGPESERLAAGPTDLCLPDCDSSSELQSVVETLERALACRPRVLTLRFIGVHHMNPDPALVIHDLLMQRSPQTRLHTVAHSPLLGGGVLLWLAGDIRSIRPNTYLFLPNRKTGPSRRSLPPWLETETWNIEEPGSEVNLFAVDYDTLLGLINQYLPVSEMLGKPILPAQLREFGLLGSGPMEDYLKTAFSPRKETSDPAPASQEGARSKTQSVDPEALNPS